MKSHPHKEERTACCKKCEIYLDYKDDYQCNNDECECHTPPHKEEKLTIVNPEHKEGQDGVIFKVGNVSYEWREGLKLDKHHIDLLFKAFKYSHQALLDEVREMLEWMKKRETIENRTGRGAKSVRAVIGNQALDEAITKLDTLRKL